MLRGNGECLPGAGPNRPKVRSQRCVCVTWTHAHARLLWGSNVIAAYLWHRTNALAGSTLGRSSRKSADEPIGRSDVIYKDLDYLALNRRLANAQHIDVLNQVCSILMHTLTSKLLLTMMDCSPLTARH